MSNGGTVLLQAHRDLLGRWRRLTGSTLAALATAPGVAVAALDHAHGHRPATAAHVLSGEETAHLHLVRAGEKLLEYGGATGVLPGHMRAVLQVGTSFAGSFTIYTRNGTIRGSGTAAPHGAGRYQSFAGSLTVTGGSGRYAHIHGRDRIYGVFDRRSYAVTVTTSGKLSY